MATARDLLGYEPIETSHWSHSARPLTPYPQMTGPITTDTVIIGGGYTGLSAALHLAEAGQDVVLLEAEQPGWAASGRNAAQVCPMLTGTTAPKIVAQYGEALGGRINRLIATSGVAVFDLIERLGIDCNPRRSGAMIVARSPKSLDTIIEESRVFAQYGARIEVVDRQHLAAFVKSDRYAGGVRYLDGGLIQPLSFARGLARAVTAAGARVFGDSAVVSNIREGDAWLVRTAKGAVRAKSVIFATGAYLDPELAPPLASVGYGVVAAMLVSHPLPDGGRSILPQGGPIVDRDDPAVFSPAIDPEGRLTIGVLVAGTPSTMKDLIPTANRRLKKAFPQLPPVKWHRHWYGRMMVTPDHLPKIIRVDENVYAGIGCQGLGITYATSTGRELARLASGAPEGSISLPVEKPRQAPMAKLMPRLMRQIIFPIVNRVGA